MCLRFSGKIISEIFSPLFYQTLSGFTVQYPIELLACVHPILRGRAAEVFAIGRDRAAVPALLDALTGEFFTVRSRAALAFQQAN